MELIILLDIGCETERNACILIIGFDLASDCAGRSPSETQFPVLMFFDLRLELVHSMFY